MLNIENYENNKTVKKHNDLIRLVKNLFYEIEEREETIYTKEKTNEEEEKEEEEKKRYELFFKFVFYNKINNEENPRLKNETQFSGKYNIQQSGI